MIRVYSFFLALILTFSPLLHAEDLAEDKITNENLMSELEDFLNKNDHKTTFKEAKLRILNKITGKSQIYVLPFSKALSLNNLEIIVDKCIYSPSINRTALLTKIYEYDLAEDIKVIFSGWLFSDHIAISTLEHPVYFVQSLQCN